MREQDIEIYKIALTVAAKKLNSDVNELSYQNEDIDKINQTKEVCNKFETNIINSFRNASCSNSLAKLLSETNESCEKTIRCLTNLSNSKSSFKDDKLLFITSEYLKLSNMITDFVKSLSKVELNHII